MPAPALITGASSGIGAAFARQLSAKGQPLILVARREDKLRELAESLPGPAEVVVADLATPEGRDAVEAAVAGRALGLLVNNAGVGSLGRFQELDRAGLLAQVALNCTAVVDLTHRFLPDMLKAGRGGVIVVSSMGAFQADPYLSVYGATKAFDLLFAEGLAVELRGSGVDVLALCPGATKTEFGQRTGIRVNVGEAMWMSPDAVVAVALRSLGRRHVVVAGVMNKLSVFFTRFAPRRFASWVAGRIGLSLMGEGA